MNTIKQQIQNEISSYEGKIKALKLAMDILEEKQNVVEEAPKRKYAKRVEKKIKLSKKSRKTKFPYIKWNETLVPFLSSQEKPITVDKITKHFFPTVHKKTKYLINSRLTVALNRLHKQGLIKAEGNRGSRGNPKKLYSIA